MGDIRNHLAKIERAASEKRSFERWQRSGEPLIELAVPRDVSDEHLDLEMLLYHQLPVRKNLRRR